MRTVSIKCLGQRLGTFVGAALNLCDLLLVRCTHCFSFSTHVGAGLIELTPGPLQCFTVALC